MKILLIIGFSLTSQYNREDYNELLSKYDKIYFTPPDKYFWKGFFLFTPGRWKIFLLNTVPNLLKKIFFIINSNDQNNSNMNSQWINFKLLKKIPAFSRSIYLNPKILFSFENFKTSFLLAKKISSLIKHDHLILPIKGIDSAGYLLDSLQRFVPNFKIYKMRSPLVFVTVWLYIYNIVNYLNWLEKFAKKNQIDSVLINHQFYMESGFISCYLHKIFNSEIIHFSVKNKYPVSVAPRVKWFKKILEEKLSHSRINKKNIEGIKKNLYQETNALVDIEDCSKKSIDRNIIVIVMHAFADANSLHRDNGVIFSSYFQWIRSTLSIAKTNKNIKYIFRSHPASFEHYRTDLKVFDYLFGNNRESNIQFEKPSNYSQVILKDKVPIFVTAKGNFSQELAIAGIKSITIDDSSAPNDCCKKINCKKEYVKWLTGKGNIDELKLSERQRLNARLNKQIFAELNNLI